MAKIIDADTLSCIIERSYCKGCNSREGSLCERECDIADILYEIEIAPSVEVHGYWIDHYKCSSCGKKSYDDMDADIWSSYEPPYCPHCGAKMDGGN